MSIGIFLYIKQTKHYFFFLGISLAMYYIVYMYIVIIHFSKHPATVITYNLCNAKHINTNSGVNE